MKNTPATPLVHSRYQEADWYRLRVFNYFRGWLALLFLTTYFNGWIEQFIQPELYNPTLFYMVSIFYVIAFIYFVLIIHQRKPALHIQVAIQCSVDIATIITLMHAIGSIRSGLGMLLLINIAMAGIFLRREYTFLIAATATLGVLGEHSYSQLVTEELEPAFIQTGILGTLIFAFAFLSNTIASRLRATEQFASEQSEQLETAVQLSEHIIRNMRTGIMVVKPDGTIEMANHSAEDLLGNIYIGENDSLKKISPALFTRLNEWHENRTMQQYPIQQRHGLPDIQPGFSPVEPRRGKHGRTLIFLEDASQLNQRFQQVKLASLGRLTASIAHEIRNPLAAIRHASQLLEETAEDPADTKMIRIISTQVQRLNDVVENVLQLSRQQRGAADTIELKPWLEQFRHEYCAAGRLSENQVSIQIEPETTKIQFNTGQLHQVLWNLCTNAINHSGMDISKLKIDIQGGNTMDEIQPFLDIINNGDGIDDEVAQQIFEPFFTTNSEGSGLGLYITKEVVESNRAKIRYIPLPAGGTCFRIYFMQPPSAEYNRAV